MKLNVELLQAYRDSHYRMQLPEGPCLLQIGQHSAEMDALFSVHNCQSAAFISACNPLSHVLPVALNRSRNGALEQVICARKLHYVVGVGYSTNTMQPWPPEPGFLILHIARADAISLAAGFGQNALLFIQPQHPVELVLCTGARIC